MLTKTAIVLAGGLGTRLRSLVGDRPKPMALVLGKPVLEHISDHLISQDIQQLIFSVGYKAEHIRKHFGHSHRGVPIRYAHEDSPMGTGGGLIRALEMVDEGESCFAINGDTFVQVSLSELDLYAQARNADWLIGLARADCGNRFGAVELDENLKVISLPTEKAALGTLANAGVFWFKKSGWEKQFSVNQKLSLERDVIAGCLTAGCSVYGFETKGLFLDIGVPGDYENAAQKLKPWVLNER